MAFFGATASSTNTNTSQNLSNLQSASSDKDVEMGDPPTDSISAIEFSSQADFLAVGSWDHSVRVYEIAPGGQSQGKAIHQHQGPVLDVCWSKDAKVFSGGADNAGRVLDVATGQAAQVAQHDAPIKCVKWVETPGGGILATGSWDKTIKKEESLFSAPRLLYSISLAELEDPNRYIEEKDNQYLHLSNGARHKVDRFLSETTFLSSATAAIQPPTPKTKL
ncbi:hypothetical protein H0H81_007695 [Sphagnurus paluster]|uniref:Anaphase-promoting complex subunit 4-like WD40 domain-containing protein n=1 Tax=Sphagnurus paluster TaxID=117069 RepID=A0A9P7GLX8_9AGAR|nr:hypothetical protein H0H81_007695 [Sphagnurus paluster]